MHPKIAARIASNVAREKRKGGAQAAAKWYETRFPHASDEDSKQIVAELRRRSGQAPAPDKR